jgi:D-glycero-D-manno-heptose 1,7-bisphosphate phosphatase
MRKTIFLDRDGTLNREAGYINHIQQFELLPGVTNALARLKDSGWQLVLISNQAGVARGYFSEAFLWHLHCELQAELRRSRAELDAIYYCPHHPTAGDFPYRRRCHCRKPQPGMLERAREDLEINMDDSYLVGDRLTDIRLAATNNLKSVLVQSGYGRGECEKLKDSPVQPDYIYPSLVEFSEALINQRLSRI